MTPMTTQTPVSGTATTSGAREHARAQEGSFAEAQPYLPASSMPAPPAGVDPVRLRWAERVAGGNYTHKVLARGTSVRLTDTTGNACASVLLYNADAPFERLSIADTVKVQWQVYTTAGQLLLSDQGRVLASVTDVSPSHPQAGIGDSFFGTSARLRNEERYGDGQPQGASPAGRELFTLAAAKHGLTRRDIPPCISFFQQVRIASDGTPEFGGSSGAGSSLTFRTEMPCIVLIANTAHPLDPRPGYSCGPLDVAAWQDTPTLPEDSLWQATPEGRRAFTNTADYLSARGIA